MTKSPIIFIGTGEHADDFESSTQSHSSPVCSVRFHLPRHMVSANTTTSSVDLVCFILTTTSVVSGMGDMDGLMEMFNDEKIVDKKKESGTSSSRIFFSTPRSMGFCIPSHKPFASLDLLQKLQKGGDFTFRSTPLSLSPYLPFFFFARTRSKPIVSFLLADQSAT
jgi:hypothetical protein